MALDLTRKIENVSYGKYIFLFTIGASCFGILFSVKLLFYFNFLFTFESLSLI